MEWIKYWIDRESTGHYFFYAFPIAFLILLFLLKGRKIRFLVPCLLVSVVIINPWFYQKWANLGLYAYWRILWVVPVIPVVAALPAAFSERIVIEEKKNKKDAKLKEAGKAGIAIIFVIAAILCGTFIYSGEDGSFVNVANAAKLPDDVVAVADRLLELKDNPRIIADKNIAVYIRQYTGKINTLFGRDIDGFIYYPYEDARTVKILMDKPFEDLAPVRQIMLNDGYDYLVMNADARLTTGFALVDKVGEYGIYEAVGTPTVIRERNELGQVVSETNVDTYGNPIIGENGWATILYSYDEDGYYSKKQWLDREGNPYLTESGYSGFEQTYDRNGSLLTRTYLGTDGEKVTRTEGYSKLVLENDDIIFMNGDVPVSTAGVYLVSEIGDGWSEWYTPEQDYVNYTFTLGAAKLGERKEGDQYSCQVEIEFKNVSGTNGESFFFRTQGEVDGRWDIGNIWNDFASFHEPPKDGVYSFSCVNTISEDWAKASQFGIGFRCDNWNSGSFRFRKIRIQKISSVN